MCTDDKAWNHNPCKRQGCGLKLGKRVQTCSAKIPVYYIPPHPELPALIWGSGLLYSFRRLSKMALYDLRRPMAPLLTILCLLLTSLVHAADANDASILIYEIGRSSNQSLLWGPYRPNLYFGIRPRIPRSLMGGLMWAKVDNYQDVQHSKFIRNWNTPKAEIRNLIGEHFTDLSIFRL